MNRKTNRKQIIDLINKIRDQVPGAVIRTSLITGFPGESDQDHLELKDFLEEYRLDRVGVFKYSREDHTPAYKMPDQIDEEVKELRQNELMEFSKLSHMKKFIKNRQDYDVLIEEKDVENIYVGRTTWIRLKLTDCFM